MGFYLRKYIHSENKTSFQYHIYVKGTEFDSQVLSQTGNEYLNKFVGMSCPSLVLSLVYDVSADAMLLTFARYSSRY